MKENTIITISRQFGSGGKEVAEKLAKKMGVRCYDRQILYLATEKMGNSDMDFESILEMAYEIPEGRFGTMGESGFLNIPYYNKMYREQAKIIHAIAELESAIFLGRCADVILKSYPKHYSFYVYADEMFRRERAKTYYNEISFEEIERENKTRERYYSYYTGQKWGDPQNYDLMINTSSINLDSVTELILEYVKMRQSKS